jgi:transposase
LLWIIWDRLSAHRSKVTCNLIAEQGKRLWVEYLPGYAPELNPVEYIWAYWKQHALPNTCPKDYWSFSEAARRALKECGAGVGLPPASGSRPNCPSNVSILREVQ